MKKYWIIGVVVAVVAAVVVTLSMFLCGGDKFVGTWYLVDLQEKMLFSHPYIREIQITKNGDAYLVTICGHSYSLKKKWRDGNKTELVARRIGENCLETDFSGIKIPLMYNEKEKTIIFDQTSYEKLDSSLEELKTKVEPQMIEAEKKREKAMKTTDGLGIRFDDIKFKK